MSAELRRDSTLVPLEDGDDVEISPGQPWPSAYRGSKYSLTTARRNDRGTVMQWQYHDLSVHLYPPEGLLKSMRQVRKSNGEGLGSFRITAAGEVLTKVHADHYPNVDEAPVSDGWIPAYLGRLEGELGLTDVNIDPSPLNGADIKVWEGLPFHHGERWSVGADGTLIWKWQDYRFESAFNHDELVARYREFRRPAGRLYVNEYGHVYVNVDPNDVPSEREGAVLSAYESWQRSAESNDKTATRRLVNRRLQATSASNDTADGLLPMYIGNLEDFDGGVVPKPIVNDPRYFIACGRDESSDDW